MNIPSFLYGNSRLPTKIIIYLYTFLLSYPLDIIKDWFSVRKELYVSRKKYLLDDLSHRSKVASNKFRFISMINSDELVVNKKSEDVLAKELGSLKFYKVNGKYEYLLDMKISSLTSTRAEALQKEAEESNKQLVILENTSETDMWLVDLKNILTT